MSLFERIKEKRINLNEQTFSDRQKSDMRKLLNKNFGSKKKAKETAGEVIKDTAKKDVARYFAKSKSKSKGGGATGTSGAGMSLMGGGSNTNHLATTSWGSNIYLVNTNQVDNNANTSLEYLNGATKEASP